MIAAAFALGGLAAGFAPQLLILNHLTGSPWAGLPAGLAAGLLHPQTRHLQQAAQQEWFAFWISLDCGTGAPETRAGLLQLAFRPARDCPLAPRR